MTLDLDLLDKMREEKESKTPLVRWVETLPKQTTIKYKRKCSKKKRTAKDVDDEVTFRGLT